MQHVSISLTEKIVCARLGVNEHGNTLACATQGDKAVHVYKFGNATRRALLKDPNMTTPVSALALDADHGRIVTGAESGALRVFDLHTEQLIRTFSSSSHKTAVTSIDYHPYGEFVVSASADTTAKVWDVRKKTCIQQYKGCPVGLTCVRCCPDGKVVVTGCEQGALRVYDLTMGKIRTQLANHASAVTSMCFHPSSMICASGGLDGIVSVVDFGSYETIFNHKGLRATDQVLFGPRTLHGVSQQSISTWDCVEVPSDTGALKCSDAPWSRVADSCYCPATDEILLVDVTQNPLAALCCTVNLAPAGSNQRLVAPTSRTGLTAQVPASQKQVTHTPTALPPSRMQAQSSLLQVANDQRNGAKSPQAGDSPPVSTKPRFDLNEMRRQKKLEKAQQEGAVVVAQQQQQPQQPQEKRMAPIQIPTPKPNPKKKPEPKPTVSDMAARLQMDSGAPPPPGAGGYEMTGDEEESALLHNFTAKSSTMTSVLSRRLTQLKVVRSFWPNDVPKALNHILKLAQSEQGGNGATDQGTVVDFLTAMNQQRMKDKITLETLPNVMEIVIVCLTAPRPTETTVMACLRLARSLNMRFKPRIEEGLRAAKHAGVGVDLNLEAKIEKAKKAYRSVTEVTEQAQQYVLRQDTLGEEARLLCTEGF